MKVFKFKKRKRYPEVTLRTIIKGYDITPEQFKWIATHQKLTESFIEEYVDRFNLEDVYKHHFMSEAFIEKYIDRCTPLCWVLISVHQQLSEEFIEKYSDKLDWYEISIHQSISEDFAVKHADNIFWREFITKKYLKEENMNKVIEYLDEDALLAAFKRKYVSDDFIKNNIDKLCMARKYRLFFHMLDNRYDQSRINIAKESIDNDGFAEEKRSH